MDMGREGKLEHLAELKESRLLQKLEECAIRSREYITSPLAWCINREACLCSLQQDTYKNLGECAIWSSVDSNFLETLFNHTPPPFWGPYWCFGWFDIFLARVGGPGVEMAEYRNCSQNFLRGIVINSFREEIEKGIDPKILLRQNNLA